jgi:hypothetical protein
MRAAFKLLSILALACGLAFTQPVQPVMPVPDCQFYFALTAGSLTSTSFSNRTAGCTAWTIAYSYTGYTALTLTVQAAPDAAGGVPGAWAAFGGAVLAGVNPNVVVASVPTQGSTVLSGYYPWLRVLLAGTAGVGTVRGVVYGYKSQAVLAVLVGFAGGTPVFCNRSLAVVLPGIGTTQIVPLAAGQTIYVCHVSMSLSAPSNVTFVRGTGANCVVGPANVSGVYNNVTAMALDFGASPLSVAAGNALCITLSAAVTAGGVVVHAVF